MNNFNILEKNVKYANFFIVLIIFFFFGNSENGEYTSKEKLPHTITEWVGSAVCINEEDGLGVSNQTTIKGFQAFFLSLAIPYSVIRGEIITVTVSVFSYVDDALPVSKFSNSIIINKTCSSKHA